MSSIKIPTNKTTNKIPKDLLEDARYRIGHYSDSAMEVVAHTHDFYEIVLCLSNHIVYEVDGTAYYLNNFDSIVILPGEVHRPLIGDITAPYERMVIGVTYDFLEKYSTIYEINFINCLDKKWERFKRVTSVSRDSRFRVLNNYVEIITEDNTNLYGKEMLVQQHISKLLLFTIRNMEKQYEDCHKSKENGEIVKCIFEVAQYIQENYDEKITLDNLSAQFYINKYYLCHEFKRTMGVPVGKYLQEQRITHALKKIMEGIPITQVALQCGFEEYSNFYKSFKKETGISPKAYAEKFEIKPYNQTCQIKTV